jgi:predicted NUDIX family NTP pyrophosphohydrolase
MPKESAGLVLHRGQGAALEVLLVHPGGPFWVKKDAGAWSIPKGELDGGEPLATAIREVGEELGLVVDGPFTPLATVRQGGGKLVHAWAAEVDFDPATLRSNTFEMEWPPRSGRRATFPEVDRAAWFDLPTAREKILAGQVPLLDALLATRAPR